MVVGVGLFPTTLLNPVNSKHNQVKKRSTTNISQYLQGALLKLTEVYVFSVQVILIQYALCRLNPGEKIYTIKSCPRVS